MKTMKLADVRKYTSGNELIGLTIDEARKLVGSPTDKVIKNQIIALNLHPWRNKKDDWERLEACLVLMDHRRSRPKPELRVKRSPA